MSLGLANTPLINYFRYKQSTFVSSVTNTTPFPVLAVADGGNGQLVITTDDTSLLSVGVAITIASTASYDGNYTVISITPTTFNISGTFVADETGTWNLATNLTGANAGDPLDFGQVFFFENADKITPLDTFSDRDLTIANTNPVTLDAVGSAPPIYLQDIPYFIRIIDKFNNLIATLDNYLPPGNSGSTSSELPLGNLLPNYGFDTRINENIYSEVSVGANTTSAVSAGWFWEIATSESDPANTYEYIELGNSNLIGNPKNELVLKSTNNTTGQTVDELYVVLGDYNKFQEDAGGANLTLTFSIFTRLQSGAPGTIAVSLQRTRNGTPEAAIGIGSINIATVRSQEILTFSVPDLTTSDYSNDDELRLVLTLPLNTDFQYGFTGAWLELGTATLSTLSISEDAGAQDAAKEFFGQSFRQLQADPQYPNRNLPIGIGLGGAIVLNQTGTIFQAGVPPVTTITAQASADLFNFAVPMGTINEINNGIELINNKEIKSTQTNRLISYLRTNGLTRSRFTFVSTVLANVVSVGTGIGTAENSTWNSLTAAVTVTKPVTELEHAVSVNGWGNGGTRWTFVDNFAPAQVPFNPAYPAPISQNLFVAGNPTNAPIISWVGYAHFFDSLNPQNVFDPHIGLSIIQGGSGSTPAIVDLIFPTNANTVQLFTGALATGPDNVQAHLTTSESVYKGLVNMDRVFNTTGIGPLFSVNYLGYNDSTSNVSPIPQIPPHVIRFTVGGAVSPVPAGTISTANIGINNDDTGAVIGKEVVKEVNTSFTYELTIVSPPTNGDIVEISNGGTDFNLIYYDTAAPSKPTNTGPREAIFVPFSGVDTSVIATATKNALDFGVMGVPRAAEIGLQFGDDGLGYFMVL